jgi:hypothetical protein
MAKLLIQFDVAEGYDVQRTREAVELRLKTLGYPTELRHGQDYTWIADIDLPLQAASDLRDQLERSLFDKLPAFDCPYLVILDDPAPPPVAPLGPRSRRSALAERSAIRMGA